MIQQPPPSQYYDIIIVGAGLAGLSMAQALAPLTKSVALLDHVDMSNELPQLDYDDRSVALSYGSSLIYQGMAIWDNIKTEAQPISTIHISDKGHFASAHLHADEENVPALGYTIENKVLGNHLHQQIQKSNVDIISSAKVQHIHYQANHALLDIKQSNGDTFTLSTQLVIAADGSHSSIREYAGIKYTKKSYQQAALIANVSTQLPHNNQAYERFTSSGPIALLPLTQNRSALVWTIPIDKVDHYLSLSKHAFLTSLQTAFGYRLGHFQNTGQRNAFPLTLIKVQKNYAKRLVLIGNASHTTHPVAGQGLNLGIRDIATLADLIAKQVDIKQDLGCIHLLKHYDDARHNDHQQVIQYTNGLIRLFTPQSRLLSTIRGGGLLSLDNSRRFKSILGRFNMGLRKNNSRLERGLSLIRAEK